MEAKMKKILVTDYNVFVNQTSQFIKKNHKERKAIALYGLVGEIGSLLAAVKKVLLAESGESNWDECNDEIIEELGDIIWYCFSLSQIENEDKDINIFTNDIALLKKEIGGSSEKSQKIHAALDPTKKEEFLTEAEHFPDTHEMFFSDYQKLSFLTARTDGRDLIEVCLAVLWQLGAELLRTTLPEVELRINKNITDRPTNVVLGEIAWHLSAVASTYKVSLDFIVEQNIEKVNYRSDRSKQTPLHDLKEKAKEQFPRVFDISFVSVGKGRTRMYFNGRRLGDELTDNAYDDDGYRFHDVMHLANVAYLGWSPVLRGLLGRKRKSNSETDEVEDGARAQIVEELVLKAIHAEGSKQSKEGSFNGSSTPYRHFQTTKSITFRLLKSLRSFVKGLEVEKNKYWEWENAIFEGSNIFFMLRQEKQGTVTVNLEERSLKFSPDVCINLKGALVGIGSGTVSSSVNEDEKDILTPHELSYIKGQASNDYLSKTIAAKKAIYNVLKINIDRKNSTKTLSIKLLDNNRVCIKATGIAQSNMWDNNILAFHLTFSTICKEVSCTAVAVADFQDIIK